MTTTAQELSNQIRYASATAGKPPGQDAAQAGIDRVEAGLAELKAQLQQQSAA